MKDFLVFFTENWYLIVCAVCALILMIMKIIQFLDLPTDKKIEEIKKRLLEFCTQAEIDIGSETGRLKLSQVYNKFCEAYPYLKKWISYERFSELVDEVLPIMKEILANKEAKGKSITE